MPLIDIDGMRVAYTDAGAGPPVVIIPGLVGTPSWFRYQFSGLSQDYRLLSYELRSARNMASYTLDMLSEDLARFLTAIKLQFAVIVGHSFGAMVAQRFATAYPQRTDALVLISGFPFLPETAEPDLIDILAPGPVHVESTFQTFLSKLLHHRKPADPHDDAEGWEWLTAHSASLSRTTLAARMAMVERFNSTSWLQKIEAPTLVMVGARDKAPFLAGAQLLYEGIPDAELEVIEDGDHFCFYTRHDLVNRAIDDFLSDRLKRL